MPASAGQLLPPRPAAGLTVRAAASGELSELAAAIDAHYASHNLGGGLASLVVEQMPPHLRAAHAVLHVVPRDGRMRNLVIDKAWFAPRA